ncbi:amino acid/polyamine transporter I [Ilyonectria sp. MPI-CAGE-AT-0026]|nr:amino acid/polyamine transporter I [Ilyonectria sp. MPI-CAGE-AT-0026]
MSLPVSKEDGSDGSYTNAKGPTPGTDLADELLENLGYRPELSRNRSTLQIAFMAFILASIPYGLATTMYYPLVGGGPVNIIWGWVLVSFIILCVAVSLGEITSIYPTAGGVYYQAFMLAPVQWRRIAGWVCGWMYLVGNITITLAVTFGTTQFIVSCVNVFETANGEGVLPGENYQVFLIFLGMTFLCNAVSALGNRWLPILDTAAIFLTIAGVLAIIITSLVLAKHGRHTAEYTFTHFEASSGWTPGWSFCIGLLQAGYGTSATGMIISMCEEVQQPSVQMPKALVATVFFNFVVGLLFLIPIVFVLPEISTLIASSQPLPLIIKSAVGSPGIAFALLIPLMILGTMCGIGCTTAASRCVWAFARDGAVPGSKWWMVVHKKLDMPLNAMMLSMAVQIILALVYFGSSAAFNAFSGVGVVCLTTSYTIPIAINLLTGRKKIKNARVNLGPFGLFSNVVAVAWALFVIPLFCMPSALPVSETTMNYASVVFVGATVISGVWYWVWGRKNYAGPPTHEE